MRKTYGRFSMHLCPREIRKVAEERIGKSFTQSFSETKTLLLTFVVSCETMKLKIREDVITLLMLPRAECGSAVGRALSPLKTNEKRLRVRRPKPWRGSTPLPGIAICTDMLDNRENHAIILNTTE